MKRRVAVDSMVLLALVLCVGMADVARGQPEPRARGERSAPGTPNPPPKGGVARPGAGTASRTPVIGASSRALQFERTAIGDSQVLNLTLANTGDAGLTISALGIRAGGDFSLDGAPRLPHVLAPGGNLPLHVRFAPTRAGPRRGDLHVRSDAASVPELRVPLSGDGAPAPAPEITLSPSKLAFGEVPVGSRRTLSLTVLNTGAVVLTLAAVRVQETGAPFAVTQAPGFPAPVPPGGSTQLILEYQPTQIGPARARLQIESDAANGRASILTLDGAGAEGPTARIVVNPADVEFGEVTVGVAARLPLQIANPGAAPLTVTGIGVNGGLAPFSVQAPPTPFVVQPGDSRALGVAFQPSTPGPAASSLRVTSDATTPSVEVPLRGTGAPDGIAELAVNPPSIDFGQVPQGERRSIVLTVASTGTADLSVSGLRVSGGSAFALANLPTLPAVLPPGGTLPVSVVFAPTGALSVEGTLEIRTNAANETLRVPLQGSGLALPAPQLAVTPTSLVFGPVALGERSILPLTLANTGEAGLTVSSLSIDAAVGAGFAIGDAPGLPAVVPPGGTVALTVAFAPLSGGTAEGTLRIASDAVSTPVFAVPLRGDGLAQEARIALNPAALAFGSVPVGERAAANLSISNIGTGDLTVTALVLEAEADAGFDLGAAPVLPALVAPGETVEVELAFAPATTGPASGNLRVVTDAPEASDSSIALSGSGAPAPAAEIVVNPPNVAFGPLDVGDEALVSLRVRNTGPQNVIISTLAIAAEYGTPFVVAEAPSLPFVVAAGDAQELTLAYRPEAEGPVSGSLVIGSDAPATPAMVVPLSGTGRAGPAPEIAATAPALDLGDVDVGTSTSATVSLASTGDADLVITALVVTAPTSAAFRVDSPPSLPLALPPGTVQPVTITFAPTAEGPATGLLRVESNARTSALLEVELAGTGVAVQAPLVAQPLALEFGGVVFGQASTLTLDVLNPGPTPRTLTSLTVTLPDAAFELIDAPALPLVLAPGETVALSVSFSPATIDAFAATLSIESGGGDSLAVELRGVGVWDPTFE